MIIMDFLPVDCPKDTSKNISDVNLISFDDFLEIHHKLQNGEISIRSL